MGLLERSLDVLPLWPSDEQLDVRLEGLDTLVRDGDCLSIERVDDLLREEVGLVLENLVEGLEGECNRDSADLPDESGWSAFATRQ